MSRRKLDQLHSYTKSPDYKMMAARARVNVKAPYFGTALWSLVPHEVDKIRRLVTRGDKVYVQEMDTFGVTENGYLVYTPAALEKFTEDQLMFVLAHETLHVLLEHCARTREAGWNPEVSNIAQDIFINDQLREGGWNDAPETMCWPETWGFERGLTADQYYWLLLEKQAEQQEKKDQRSEAGQCSQCGSGDHQHDEGEDGEKCPDQKPGEVDGEPDLTDIGGSMAGDNFGYCGSGAGRELENEKDLPEDGKRSQAEMDRLRQSVAAQVAEEARKNPGSVPAGLKVWAEKMSAPPKVNWKDKLKRVARRAVSWARGHEDFRYGNLHRRQAGHGFGARAIILPTMVAPQPNVVVAVDTSGSMGKSELEIGLRELDGIFTALRANVVVCSCDADVHEMKPCSNWREAARSLKGGGGTSFIPIFEAVNRMSVLPDILVVVTDGWGPAPARPPRGYKTIWLEVGSGSQAPCEWGDHIKLED